MKDIIERLTAEKSSSFEYKNGVYICDRGGLSEVTLICGGDKEALRKLSSEYKRPIICDTDADIASLVKKSYNLYVCRSFAPKSADGETVSASPSDCDKISSMISQMLYDSAGINLPAELADNIAKTKYHEVRLFKNDGICAMARIAFLGDRYARINTVFTLKEKRGRGYAGALISDICSEIIGQGLIPTVLADVNNEAANRLYSSLGFVAEGKVFEYISHGCDNHETALTCNSFS